MFRQVSLALALAITFGLAPPQAHAQRLNRQAAKAYELGNFAEAAEAYERIVRKGDADPGERARYAEALRLTGRAEEAEAIYASIDDPADAELAYRHARALVELARYPQAVERLAEAARLKHPSAGALANRIEYAQAHRETPAAWKVSNEYINAAGDDYAAAPVGDFVVLASARDGGAPELYRTTRDNNGFLRVPTRLHRVGADAAGEAPLAYSPSGDLVAYTRNNFAPGERFLPEVGWELSLMLAPTAEADDFLAGKAFPHNGTGYSTGFPSFSPDGGRLYFASDRPGGEGGFDLYYSVREPEGWGPPVNLGPTVNSPGNEVTPYVTEGALYFASDYLPGFGGMDLYRADRLGEQYTGVVNLGWGVNSPLDDLGFALAGESSATAYLASNRAGGKGGLDVYRATRTGTAVTFAVVDGKTGRPIPNAVLDFSDCGQGVFLTGVDGSFSFRALPSLDCRPFVRKSGFNAKQFSFVAKGLKDQQRVELVLNPEDRITIYEGKIVDSRTGDAIADARVFARHRSREFSAEAKSDSVGSYELSLERGGEYTVEYVARGYHRIDREITTAESAGAGVLSTFALFPQESLAAADARARVRPTVDPDSVPGEARTAGDATPGVGTDPALATSIRTDAESSVDYRAGTVDAGYSVQVAAVKVGAADLADYRARFADFGPVYGRVEGDLIRIRIGPFDSRDGAEAVLGRVRAGAVKDAFLAAEAGGPAIGLPDVRAVAAEPAAANPVADAAASTPVPSIDPPAAKQTPGAYLIRLATFSSLANFDQAKAGALGDLTTRRSGEYVVVLLQGFDDADAARARVDSVRSGGYPDAHVVQEMPDGSLRIVR